MISIPSELLAIKQWTISHSLSDLKRPLDSLYRHGGAWDYHKAKRQAGEHKRIGFYVTPEDPYILGDIDHVDHPMDREYIASTLPMGFCDLLFNHSVYSEASPSGNGIRFIARLKDTETKAQLIGDYRKNRDPLGFSSTEVYPEGHLKAGQPVKREAQLNIGRPWQTITGNTTPYSSNRISVITLDMVQELFNFKLKSDQEVVGTDYRPPPDLSGSELPSLQEIVQALRQLPWDENPRIQRAFKLTFEEEYSSYEYWLKVLMAVSDYASRLANPNDVNICLEEIVKWSAKDEAGFESEEDVINKWESFFRQEMKVTYHTLLSLVWYNSLHWPQVKPLSKKQIQAGVTTSTPLVAQYANFKAMIDFYGLKLYRDANNPHKMYIDGDYDIIEKYFRSLETRYYHGKYHGPWTHKTLATKFNAMCQDHGYVNVTMANMAQNIAIWAGEIYKTVDLVKLYFDTPYDQLLPEYRDEETIIAASSVEFLYDCLDIDHLTNDPAKEEAIYFKYYKSWLMGIARNIFYPKSQHMNNCVLLLTGPEQVRKTSHFKYILPEFMREERVAFTTHGFANEGSVRDVTKLASTNNVIVWDEIEQYLDSDTESNFKKLIDNNPVKIIDKYEVLDTFLRPIAVYGGTSNKQEFQLSDTGSRRLFIIPVKWVDTDAMTKVNWWKVINDLKDEIIAAPAEEPPWLLSEEQLQFQSLLHSKVTTKSSLDLIIDDMFDFNSEWVGHSRRRLPEDFDFNDSSYMWTAAAISKRVRRSGISDKFTRKHLINVLKRACSKWTETTRKTRTFDNSTVVIKKGVTIYGGRDKFWMPPLRESSSTKQEYFTSDDATNY